MASKEIKRGISLYLDGKAVTNSAKAIRSEMAKVKGELDKLIVGTDEYNTKARQYQVLNAALKEHRQNMMGAAAAQRNWLNKGIELFNKYSVAILGAAAALTGVAMQLSSFRKKMNEKEESQANLAALTGLDDDSIAWLTHQAETLSSTMEKSGLRVRQSAQEIIDAYTMVGSKKPELLADKEALNAVTIEALRLANAAKIELKEAVAGVTLAMNQYGAAADQASRYVNVLAAGSKFGAVGVATQTESIVKAGVSASVAKVPIEQLVGVLEALGEKGIEGSIAGTQLKTFFLKLEAGADDTRPSVVGLQTALENLRRKSLSTQEMVKMFGLESYTTAAALVASVDKVKYYTDAVTDTAVATEQAAINSDTAAAKLAQVRNQITETGMVLAKDLAPIFSKMMNLTTKFIMAMPPLVNWLKEYGAQLLILVGSFVAYNTYAIVAAKVTAAWQAVVTAANAVAVLYRNTIIQLHLMFKGAAAAQITFTKAVLASNFAEKAAIAVTSLFRAAVLAMSGEFQAATVALKGFRIALASTGIGGVILLVGALTAGYVSLISKIKSVREERAKEKELQSGINRQYNEEAAKLKTLRDRIHNQALALGERNNAIKEMKRIIPDYEAHLDKEGRVYKENTQAIDDYLKKLRMSITMKAAEGKMTENISRMMALETEMEEKRAEILERQRQLNNYSTNTGPGSGTATVGIAAMKKAAEDDLKALQAEYEKLDKANKKLDEKIKKSATAGGSFSENTPAADPDPSSPTNDDAKNKKVEQIEAAHLSRLADLKKKFLSGEIASEAEYNRLVEKAEWNKLNTMLKIADIEPSKREEIKNKILDMTLSLNNRLKEIENSGSSDEAVRLQKRSQQIQDSYNQRLADLQQALDLELITEERYNELKLLADAEYANRSQQIRSEIAAKEIETRRSATEATLLMLEKSYIEGKSKEEDYSQKRRDIINSFYQEALANQNLSQEERKELQSEYDKWVVDETADMADKHNEKIQSMFNAYKQLGEDAGKELAEFITSTEKSFEGLARAMLRIILDSLQKILVAAIAQRTIENIRTLGFLGVAKAAGEIALLTTAFETAKAAIGSFYTGGYTGRGAWNEPAGVVHKDEFVANRFAVANPNIKPVLDLIDIAQKNGSVGNLSMDDIRSVTGSMASGGYAQPSTTTVVQSNLSGVARLIKECNATMASVRDRFNQPITARTYATGKYGTIEAEERANKMIKNASRQ